MPGSRGEGALLGPPGRAGERGPRLLGTAVVWGRRCSPGVPLDSRLHPFTPCTRPTAWRLQSSRARPSPIPPLLSAFRARAYTLFPAFTSAEKAGEGRRQETKTHARPLHSRLRKAGTASAVCACALRHCGFRVCLCWTLYFGWGTEGQTQGVAFYLGQPSTNSASTFLLLLMKAIKDKGKISSTTVQNM